MKKYLLLLLIVVTGVVVYFIQNPIQKMQITSTAFAEGAEIPDVYSCYGDNISPPLDIKNVPEEAKSLALIVQDVDSSYGLWVNWLKWNIDPGTIHLNQGVEPNGISGKGSRGLTMYDGPCHADGTHRIRFKLYALDKELSLPEESSWQDLEAAMKGSVIKQTEHVGVYTPK